MITTKRESNPKDLSVLSDFQSFLQHNNGRMIAAAMTQVLHDAIFVETIHKIEDI